MISQRIYRMMFAVLAAASIVASGTAVADAAAADSSTQAAPAQARAATPVWGVYNGGSVSTGLVLSGWPSSTNYDAVVSPGWWAINNVYGVYIGSGYCSQRWTSTSTSGPWTRAGSDFMAGKYQLSGNYYVKIVPYKAYSSTRCVAP